jgi:hypothetical protein
VVNKCPTQALEWKYNKDLTDSEKASSTQSVQDEETPKSISDSEKLNKPVKVQVMKNGPIVVEGNFKVIGSTGNELKSMIMTSFCRCGGSQSMPFCDGTHRKVGFAEDS